MNQRQTMERKMAIVFESENVKVVFEKVNLDIFKTVYHDNFVIHESEIKSFNFFMEIETLINSNLFKIIKTL